MIFSHPMLLSAIVLASSTVSALFIPQASPIKIPFYTKGSKLAKRGGIDTPLTSFTDGAYYYAEVQIGTPPQKFDLVLDTGSADLFVNSLGCPKKYCQFNVFNETASTTYVSSDNDALVNKYGVDPKTVYVNGSFGYETVTMGGITVKNQKFARAYNLSSVALASIDPEFAQPEGIVGLGFPDLTNSPKGPYSPLLFSMYQQGSIPSPIFSWYYAPGFVTSRIQGELMLGGVDASKYTGDFQYTPVLDILGSKRYWQSYIQSFGVTGDGSSSNYSFFHEDGNNSLRAIFDTGTPLTIFPASYVKSMYIDLTGSEPTNSSNAAAPMYAIDCAVAKTNKRVHLDFSRKGNDASMDEHPLVIDIPVSSLILPVDNIDVDKATVCYLGIQSSETTNFFLLGQSILHNFYLSFDFGKNQTGFAVPVNSTASVYIA
ncbi:unnamed protein product [Rhizopus stolonifer]